jgi:sulfur carrier protein ThiS
MNIKIEFYASLMKYLPPGKERFRRDVKVDDGFILNRLIRQYQISEAEAHIVLVNGHFVNHADRDTRALESDDVVSIWPPVAGG